MFPKWVTSRWQRIRVQTGYKRGVRYGYGVTVFSEKEEYPRGTLVSSMVFLITVEAKTSFPAKGNLVRGEALKRRGWVGARVWGGKGGVCLGEGEGKEGGQGERRGGAEKKGAEGGRGRLDVRMGRESRSFSS